MDVVRIEKTDETFRVLYDTKGRFVLKSLSKEDAKVILHNSMSIGKTHFNLKECFNDERY